MCQPEEAAEKLQVVVQLELSQTARIAMASSEGLKTAILPALLADHLYTGLVDWLAFAEQQCLPH